MNRTVTVVWTALTRHILVARYLWMTANKGQGHNNVWTMRVMKIRMSEPLGLIKSTMHAHKDSRNLALLNQQYMHTCYTVSYRSKSLVVNFASIMNNDSYHKHLLVLLTVLSACPVSACPVCVRVCICYVWALWNRIYRDLEWKWFSKASYGALDKARDFLGSANNLSFHLFTAWRVVRCRVVWRDAHWEVSFNWQSNLIIVMGGGRSEGFASYKNAARAGENVGRHQWPGTYQESITWDTPGINGMG